MRSHGSIIVICLSDCVDSGLPGAVACAVFMYTVHVYMYTHDEPSLQSTLYSVQAPRCT